MSWRSYVNTRKDIRKEVVEWYTLENKRALEGMGGGMWDLCPKRCVNKGQSERLKFLLKQSKANKIKPGK